MHPPLFDRVKGSLTEMQCSSRRQPSTRLYLFCASSEATRLTGAVTFPDHAKRAIGMIKVQPDRATGSSMAPRLLL